MAETWDSQYSNPGGTAMSLLRTVGGFSRPSGRGWFMFRCLTTGSTTAALVGLTTAITLGTLTGAGAIGFIIGSCIGFCGGTLHYYFLAKEEAFAALLRYPGLMQHHLQVNFPSLGYEDLDIQQMLKAGTLRQWFEGHGERDIETWGITRRGGVLGREHRIGQMVAGFARQGQLMSSYHTAVDTMVEVENRKEARIIESIVESEIASERAHDKGE